MKLNFSLDSVFVKNNHYFEIWEQIGSKNAVLKLNFQSLNPTGINIVWHLLIFEIQCLCGF